MNTNRSISARAQSLIAELQLRPHPEGGYYRELYRAAAEIQPADARGARAALTTIYYLLTAGACSRWHRVTSDEVWHLYEGGPLELLVADPEFASIQRVLLQTAAANSGPVHVIPAGWWQAARPAGDYVLTGCTVAPGFDFTDFSFLRDFPALIARLRAADPSLCELL